MDNQERNLLYKGNTRVNQGTLKVKTSTKVRGFFKKLLSVVLTLALLVFVTTFIFYATESRARVDGKLILCEELDEYNIDDKVIVNHTPEFFDTMLYIMNKKHAMLMKVDSLPYSLVSVDNRPTVLSADEYYVVCESDACKSKETIVTYDMIVGKVKAPDENKGFRDRIRIFYDRFFSKAIGEVSKVTSQVQDEFYNRVSEQDETVTSETQASVTENTNGIEIQRPTK